MNPNIIIELKAEQRTYSAEQDMALRRRMMYDDSSRRLVAIRPHTVACTITAAPCVKLIKTTHFGTSWSVGSHRHQPHSGREYCMGHGWTRKLDTPCALTHSLSLSLSLEAKARSTSNRAHSANHCAVRWSQH